MPHGKPDPRWELTRDLEHVRRASALDAQTPPLFEVSLGSPPTTAPIWMRSPRFHYPFGPDVPVQTITIEFDHRISKNTLKAWLDLAYPEMKRSKDEDGQPLEPIVRESRATWDPKTLDMIRYVCLETGGLPWMGRSAKRVEGDFPRLARRPSWRQRWVGWNATRRPEWRFNSQTSFHKRFLEIERNFTGWPFGLAWFYDPLERMRLGTDEERARFAELLEAEDGHAVKLANRAKQRQESIGKKQWMFKQWIADRFPTGGPLVRERNTEFLGPPPTDLSESPSLNVARQVKRLIEAQPGPANEESQTYPTTVDTGDSPLQQAPGLLASDPTKQMGGGQRGRPTSEESHRA